MTSFFNELVICHSPRAFSARKVDELRPSAERCALWNFRRFSDIDVYPEKKDEVASVRRSLALGF